MIRSDARVRRRWRPVGLLAVAVAMLTMPAVASSAPRPLRALDVSVSGAGTITAAGGIDCGERCDARYRSGRIVELTATPSPNETFEGWAGDCYGEAPFCSLLLDRRTRVRAIFRPIPQEVSITVGGAGTVTSQPPGLRCGTAAAVCTAPFGQGTTIQLLAAPDRTGGSFTWGGACETQHPSGCDLTVGANGDVANRALATFSDAAPSSGQHTLTVDATASAGVRIEPAGTDCGAVCVAPFPASTPVTLSSPNATWSGACVGDAPRCAIVVDQPTSVTAVVRHPNVEGRSGVGLTVNAAQGGTVTAGKAIRCSRTSGRRSDCSHTFSPGQSVTLKASAARGWRFFGWSRSCARSKTAVCTLSLFTNSVTTAIFRRR